jgi:signal transduction histidine kinase
MLILFRFKKYLVVIHVFSTSIILVLLVLTFFIFGKVPGYHFYFILFAFVPLPYFPADKKIYPLIYFISSLGCFLYVELLNPAGIVDFPQGFIVPVKLVSIVLSLSTTMLILILYYSKSEKNEYELHKAKEDLENKNQELAESNAEIGAQKESLTHLNEILTETNRTKNLFFSIISHDLKNPLTALVGLVEVLNSSLDTNDREEIKVMVGSIALSTNSLYDLVIKLLEWTRTQTGRIEAKFVPCVLKDFLEANEAMCREMAKQKNIRFNFSMNEDLVFETDESLLGTIIRNIFTNAIKYSYQGGEITVSVTKKSRKVIIAVKDNGVGMTKEMAANLFKIDKVDSTPGTNEEKGTGLGLIISYEFVKILNGTIDVISSIEKGCEFLISLPLKNKN